MVWEEWAPLLPQFKIVLNARKLATSRVDDPAFNLFGKHPSPEQLQSVCNEQDLGDVAWQRARAVEIFQWYNNHYVYPSNDPDYNFLLANISNKLNVKEASFDHDLQSTLTQLALRTDPQSLGTFMDKTKDRLLEYYRWVAHGRKDGQFQFITRKLTANKPSPPANGSVRIDDAPNAYNKFEVLAIWRPITEICCPNFLGTGSAPAKCSRCAIRHAEDHVTGMEHFCNYDCAVKFGPAHREECGELGMVYRMTGLITDIMLYFELRACSFTIASITEADGLIVVQEKDPRLDDRPGSQQLCPTTAATHDQWRVVAGEFASPDWYYITQILTNTLLPYVVEKTHRMSFFPKNAYKTVQRILPDDRPLFNMLQTHEILCLTTPSGIELAFDPTGARFGWREILSPLADYISQRVHCVQWKIEIDPELEIASSRPPVNPQSQRGRYLYAEIETSREKFYYRMARKMVKSQLRWLHENHGDRRWDFEDALEAPSELFKELRKHSVEQVKQLIDAELEKTFRKEIPYL